MPALGRARGGVDVSLILVIAVAILGYMLMDTRRRLTELQRDVDERIGLLRRQQFEAAHNEPPVTPPAQSQTKAWGRYEGPARITNVNRPLAPPPLSETVPEPKVAEFVPAETIQAPSPLPNGPWSAVSLEPVSQDHEPETEPASLIERLRPSGFEDLFGRRLPIWAGGVTLLVAAVLLVRYSIDAGLLSPEVRVAMGFLFGSGLIAGAEMARRFADKVQDPRVAQALAGAGLGALYIAILASHALYALMGPATAFAGLTAITVLAMSLSIRFGVPCAVLALVGGLATPALVQSDAPNVPLLAGYLAMIIGSLTVLSRQQRWFWLGATALAGGFGWSLIMILMGALDRASIAAMGLLVILLGLAFPAFDGPSPRAFLVRTSGAVIASLQLALLVSSAGYDMLSWGLYGLLSLGFLAAIKRAPALRRFLAVPLLAALGLAAFWPQPPIAMFVLVLAGIALIFGIGVLQLLWRAEGDTEQALHLSIASLGSYGVLLWHAGLPDRMTTGALALTGLGFAVLPALGLVLGWRSNNRSEDLRFPLIAGVAAVVLALAALVALPQWMAPIGIGLMAGALLLLAIRAHDGRIALIGLGFTVLATLALVASGDGLHEMLRFVGEAEKVSIGQALARWGSVGILWLAFAWHYRHAMLGQAGGVACAAFAYAIAAQMVPGPWLALVTAVLFALLVEARRRVSAFEPLRTAAFSMALILFCWLAGPMFAWLQPALSSAIGEPMLVTALPDLASWCRIMLVPALLGGIAIWRLRGDLAALPAGLSAFVAILPIGIAFHGLYKHLFAINGAERFVQLGLAERTLWEACLVVAGFALWRWRRHRASALALLAVAAGHALLYTLIIHNPLLSAQAVGSWPVLNLLLPSLGMLFALPTIARSIDAPIASKLQTEGDILRMVVMLLLGLMTLRQLAMGSVFAGQPLSQLESIGWSVLAIAMAIGWLFWGLQQQTRTWRIGSLLLMLIAIAKVFFIDASGLTGLLRILSFLALGFSLIGIGWLYNRALKGGLRMQEAGRLSAP
jgi:uncharacterized membrane protein